MRCGGMFCHRRKQSVAEGHPHGLETCKGPCQNSGLRPDRASDAERPVPIRDKCFLFLASLPHHELCKQTR